MFFDLIMQAAAPTIAAPTVVVDPTTSAILGTLGLIGAGIGSLVTWLKSKQGIELTGAMSLAALRKGTEAKEAVLKLTPEDKKALVKELAQEVVMGVKQEETLIKQHPKMNPNNLDIPREKHDTKPAI